MRILFILLIYLSLNACSSVKKISEEVRMKDFVQLNEGDSIFYSKFEVTNKQYKEFLEDIKDENRHLFLVCAVKSEYWSFKELRSLGKAHERNYFNHAVYDEFPVVNITYEAAKYYCKLCSTLPC